MKRLYEPQRGAQFPGRGGSPLQGPAGAGSDEVRGASQPAHTAPGSGGVQYHLEVSIVPTTATADALADDLIALGSLENLRVLVVTGNRNRDDLVRSLRRKGPRHCGLLPGLPHGLDGFVTKRRWQRESFPEARGRRHCVHQRIYGGVFRHAGPTFGSDGGSPAPAGLRQWAAHRQGFEGAVAMPVNIEAPEHSLDGLVAAIREKLTMRP